MSDDQCRICLKYVECAFQLSDMIGNRAIWEIINVIADVSVSVGDHFFQFICENCSDKLEEIIAFKSEIERSNEELHSYDTEYDVQVKAEDNPIEEVNIKEDTNTTSSGKPTDMSVSNLMEMFKSMCDNVNNIQKELVKLNASVTGIETRITNIEDSLENPDKLEKIKTLQKPTQDTTSMIIPTTRHHMILDKVGHFKTANEVNHFDNFISQVKNANVLLGFRKILNDLPYKDKPSKFVTTRMNAILGVEPINGYYKAAFTGSKMYRVLIESVKESFGEGLAVSLAENAVVHWFGNWGRKRNKKIQHDDQQETPSTCSQKNEIDNDSSDNDKINFETNVAQNNMSTGIEAEPSTEKTPTNKRHYSDGDENHKEAKVLKRK